jgi:excisionase family DNA binding protein
MSERLLTVPEVAARLRGSRYFVYDLVKSGKLPAVRLGGKVLFREGAVEDLVKRAEGGEARG